MFDRQPKRTGKATLVEPAESSSSGHYRQARQLLLESNWAESEKQFKEAIADARLLLTSWRVNFDEMLELHKRVSRTSTGVLKRPLPGSRRPKHNDDLDQQLQIRVERNALPFLVHFEYSQALLKQGQLTAAKRELQKALKYADIVDESILKRELKRVRGASGGSRTYAALLEQVIRSKADAQKLDLFLNLDHSRFLLIFDRLVSRWHHGRYWWVSEELLDKSIQDPTFRLEEALVIAALKMDFNDINELTGGKKSSGKIYAKQIAQICKWWETGIKELGKDQQELICSIEQTIGDGRDRLLESQQPSTKLALPVPLTVHNRVGDCYFLSAISAFCRHDPACIESMVVANPNGTYTVKFNGLPDEPMIVPALTDSEIAMLPSTAGTDNVTTAILEKAFLQYLNRQWERKRGATPKSRPVTGMRLIAPDHVRVLLKDSDLKTISAQIKSAVAEHRPCIAIGPQDSRLCSAIKRRSQSNYAPAVWNYLVNQCNSHGHAMVITDIVENASGECTVQMLDHTRDRAALSMPLAEFISTFKRIEIATS